MSKEFLLGVDIGGTKCAVVLGNRGDSEKKIIDKLSFPTNAGNGWRHVISEIFDSCDRILNNNSVSNEQLYGIGISCGGPLNSEKGVVMSPPNLPDWDNVPVKALFEERYGATAVLQNDANACAVAEWKYGAGKGYDNCIFLTFGTGMGAGLILGGRLYTGANDMAGEVGHIRLSDDGPEGYGKKGSFEGFCSGGGISRLADYMSGGKNEKTYSAKELAQMMYNGDKFAESVYVKCAEKLGEGLSILIDILNPDVIVIGSIFTRNTDFFNSIILPVISREALKLSSQVCRIVPAALNENIGDYAALGLAELEV